MCRTSEASWKKVIFHEGSTAAKNGQPQKVEGFTGLLIEIYGADSNTARTVTFYGKSYSGTVRAIAGVKMSDFSTASSTTGDGELWRFDITGLNEVVMALTAITDGNVTVVGRMVA